MGVLAVPGEYTYGDRKELKTYEELEAAAERQPILPLTYGHPAGGIPRASDFIGTVSQRPRKDKQRVDGEFWFYDEIPREIREKIVNEWPTAISAGFTVDSMQDRTQKGLFYTHIAVLRDGEDPKCPLNKCGVNVRMESNSTPPDYRYEKAQDPTIPEEKQPAAEKAPITMEALQAQIAELKALVVQLNANTRPAEQKPEATPTPEPEAPTTRTTPTPRRIIPAGETKSEDELKYDSRGMILLG